MARGDVDAAMQAFERSRQADDSEPDSYYLEAKMRYRRADWPTALERFKAAYQRDRESPSSAIGVFSLGRLTGAPQTELTLEALRSLFTPEDEYYGAQIEALGGKAESALSLLERAVAETPGLQVYARFEPAFHELRSDPRFLAMTTDLPGSGWSS